MEQTIFQRIAARVANAFQTGGFDPLPRRNVDALAFPAATGLPGRATVRDLEKYQVSFGANRFGDSSGGFTFNPAFEGGNGMDYSGDVGPISKTPGFKVGDVFSGSYRPAQPRSPSGVAPHTEMTGGFLSPESTRDQV